MIIITPMESEISLTKIIIMVMVSILKDARNDQVGQKKN